MARPGPLNLITDVPGLSVGNAVDERVRTGVTALLCPGGWNAAVDVRGGGPGERELSALALEGLVGQAHAIVFSGGSVFGLGAGDGATAALSLKGQGLKLHPASPFLPIVPTVILHDLGNGGDKAFGLEPPYRRLGIEAVEAAGTTFALGPTGAGRGARAGLIPGGLGSASVVLEDGLVVGALAAVNPLGSVLMPDGETFWAWPFEMDGEFGGA
ncbi:MAG: P1 family peptidase, partial [Caulobacteraceae bacterium]